MEKVIEKAAVVVHWPSGPVLACLDHAKQMKTLGSYLGAHVHVEPYSGDEACTNCVNAAKK